LYTTICNPKPNPNPNLKSNPDFDPNPDPNPNPNPNPNPTVITDPQIGPRDPQIVTIQIPPLRILSCAVSFFLTHRTVISLTSSTHCISYNTTMWTTTIHPDIVQEYGPGSCFSNIFRPAWY